MSGDPNNTRIFDITTGDAIVDGMSARVAWGPTTITYAFPDAGADYDPTNYNILSPYDEPNNFAAFNAAQKAVSLAALSNIAGFTNVGFTLGSDATANIRMANSGAGGYTIMEDSDRELSKHLDALRHAKGRVLKTGLGMGCFVRGCLSKPEVDHIDVIEIDPEIAEHFGREFARNPRVTIHVCDAFHFDLSNIPKKHWDIAWHDIYCEGNDGLMSLHTGLMKRFKKYSKMQGAWDLPRWSRKMLNRGGKRRVV